MKIRPQIFLLIIFFCGKSFAQSLVFESSNLPIFIINTDFDSTIVDDFKIPGTLRVLYNGVGNRNYLADTSNTQGLHYNGRLAIELRGKYSLNFPQKSYGFETRKADNITNNNVSLLGYPKENDWILTAQYMDKSFLRDFVAYDIFRQLDHYSPRGQFVEVFVNNEYMGVYLFQEKIKVDKNRLDLESVTGTDPNTQEITGGYIFQENDGFDFVLPHDEASLANGVEINHPKIPTENQRNYIRDYMLQIDEKMQQINPSNLVNGYTTLIDVQSAYDFFLANEAMHNSDSYSRSTFWHKDRNGKVIFGPIWDFNIAAGNDTEAEVVNPNYWEIETGITRGPRFLGKLFADTTFRCHMAQRWQLMRAPHKPFATERIHALIDSMAILLNEAQFRHFEKWGNMGNCGLWTAYGCENRFTYQDEIDFLKSFLAQKMAWMDQNVALPDITCTLATIPNVVINEIMFKPTQSNGFLPDDLEFIELKNNSPESQDLSSAYFKGGGIIYQFPYGALIPPNGFMVLASNAAAFEQKYGFAPAGQFFKHLSDTAEPITLNDAYGEEIDHVAYNTAQNWPVFTGKSIALSNSVYDNANAQNWFLNDFLGGTPNAENNNLVTPPDPCTTNYPKLVINEINYHGNVNYDAGDWIEIYNPNTTAISLNNYQLINGANTIMNFPANASIGPNAYLVIVQNLDKFSVIYPSVTNVLPSVMPFDLNNNGESITLKNNNNCNVDIVSYGNIAPYWPTTPNGLGYILSLKNTSSDNYVPSNWEASTLFLGTPGQSNNSVVSGPLAINFIHFTCINSPYLTIDWQVVSTSLVKSFEIEFSKDSQKFINIETILASNKEKYQFTSQKPEWQSGYFRIKTLDINGKVNYSKIIFLEQTDKTKYFAYPVPCATNFQIHLPDNDRNQIQLQVFDLAGRLILNQFFEESLFQNPKLELPKHLQNGLYIVKIKTPKTNKVIKISVLK